jgi:hypothetical protein
MRNPRFAICEDQEFSATIGNMGLPTDVPALIPMTEPQLSQLITGIRNALGCGKDLASDYANAIGDNPEISKGKILVRDETGRIVAYVPESAWASVQTVG